MMMNERVECLFIEKCVCVYVTLCDDAIDSLFLPTTLCHTPCMCDVICLH